uniref:uncharacterized protein LOC129516818 n=1 Tax=Nyctereutes procyonoides TaxID=34880 RepID=UPI002443BAF2|nr:uncharacterized protein LOC129516818 [Nyctereutes procyonoides]
MSATALFVKATEEMAMGSFLTIFVERAVELLILIITSFSSEVKTSVMVQRNSPPDDNVEKLPRDIQQSAPERKNNIDNQMVVGMPPSESVPTPAVHCSPQSGTSSVPGRARGLGEEGCALELLASARSSPRTPALRPQGPGKETASPDDIFLRQNKLAVPRGLVSVFPSLRSVSAEDGVHTQSWNQSLSHHSLRRRAMEEQEARRHRSGTPGGAAFAVLGRIRVPSPLS